MAVMLAVAPGAAQTKQQLDWCEHAESAPSLDRAIEACTAAIRSGKWRGESLAWAYVGRSSAWGQNGDPDRSIADANEAIRLNPKLARAYSNRGISWRHKGDLDRAIADGSEAIRLDPKDALVYRARGSAYFTKGDFSAAAADLVRATDLGEDPYAMLWRFLARGWLRQDGAAELGANAARLKTRDWPYAVIDFYLGRRSLGEMNAATDTPERKCEAAFYLGEWHLLQGNAAEAAVPLKIAADTCPKGFDEHAAAIAELKRLKP